MAKQKLTDNEQVTNYITTSIHPLAATMEALRQVILDADASVSEQIKWNAPAFYYNGAMAAFDAKDYKRDIVVFNLRKNDYILLIFPTGASIDDDPTGILEGDYADGRRMVFIYSKDDLSSKKNALQQVIKNWLTKVQK
ncbi:DUF1801 domain-containing protein [Flavobacterium subsaxonicum]|uniref:DUF1801 domain-containing protein n=1 Tax=Flavobacterium subsaxonicum TaxID=426226 RepID=UPI000423641C|nr:DUF1801 domain-containing protein [Flavobacterium subsaxonicum]